jgi:ATP adenylyltransferase
MDTKKIGAGELDYLWSPWRMSYINQSERKEQCVFCAAQEGPASPENLVVARGRQAFVILNRYPYTSGHLMVVPNPHLPSLEFLDPDVRAEMMELVSQAVQVLREVYKPQGFNIGINIGAAAGAGIADHIHMHIVPRWSGDTNFMSSLGQTRVLPENLEDTYLRVQQAWPGAISSETA